MHLAQDPARVYTKDELLRAVWGIRSVVMTRTLDSHASRLRAQLLSERAIPVHEVAQQAGYRQASHFAQVFRCRYGVSPTGFRTRALSS